MFDIVTICNRKYRKCFYLTIESWINCKDVDRIHVYTDCLKYDHEKIKIIPYFSKENDWIDNVSLKPDVLLDYASSIHANKRFIFLDVDNYIVSSFGEVFDQDFNIAVTGFESPYVSSGNIFFVKNDTVFYFLETWKNLKDLDCLLGIGMDVHYSHNMPHTKRTSGPACEMLSLDKLCRTSLYFMDNIFGVKGIPENVYNCNSSNPVKLEKLIKQYNPKIVHLKSELWKDQEIIKKLRKYNGKI